MVKQRGLSTKSANRRFVQAVTLASCLLAGVAFVASALARPTETFMPAHILALVLIALASFGVFVFPTGVWFVIGAATVLSVLSSWAITGSSLLGFDALASVALIGLASAQQRRRQRRMFRLKRTLNDLDEELYLKEQAVRIAQKAHEALGRKIARYQHLQTIAERLSRLVRLPEVCQLAVDQAFELIGKSDACLLFMVNKERQELALCASKKAPGVSVIRAKQGDQFDRYVLRTQRPLLVHDVRHDFRFGGTGLSDRPIASVIACPVLLGQSAEGVLRLDATQAGLYTQDDLRLLDILLDLVNTAIANARLFTQTQELAVTDGLTGVFRRQPFLDQLAREVARAHRTKEPLAVLMLDIDDFKRYNDSFGHTAGDLLLKIVAEIARDAVGPDGMCARYGGEEFAMFLPKSSRAQAVEVARRIRQSVEEKARSASLGTDRFVTVSLGVAAFPDDAKSDIELLRRSDEWLYQAKRQGKNRVCPS